MVTFLNQLTGPYTIKSLLKWAFLALKETSASPELDAEIILSYAIGKNREYLYAHPEDGIFNKKALKFKRFIKRRKKHEPVAYIAGEKEFYGLMFKVNKNVLIPRPETEMIVDEVLRIAGKTENVTLIDVGTGSGCIPVAVAKKLENACAGARAHAYAIDISKKALSIAKENAKRNRVDKYIKFLHGDLLGECGKLIKQGLLAQISTSSPCPPFRANKVIPCDYEKSVKQGKAYNTKKWGELIKLGCMIRARYEHKKVPLASPLEEPIIIITANLPYLPEAIYKNCSEDIKMYEPKKALVAGYDGLKYYKSLFREIRNYTARRKVEGRLAKRIIALCEIDPSQKVAMKFLAKKYFPKARVQIKKDLCGLARLVILTISANQGSSLQVIPLTKGKLEGVKFG